VLAGLAGLVSVVAAIWIISLFPRVRDAGAIRETISWVPSLGEASVPATPDAGNVTAPTCGEAAS
jgi:hypothetical protein